MRRCSFARLFCSCAFVWAAMHEKKRITFLRNWCKQGSESKEKREKCTMEKEKKNPVTALLVPIMT